MTATEIDTGVRKLFGQLFPGDPAELDDDVRRGELDGWDSLGHLDLVAALEEHFKVAIDVDDALEMETFGETKRVLAKILGSA